MAVNNTTEFCGGCFDPDGDILYLNQQGERGGGVDGPSDANAVTYAIFGPFNRRRRDRRRDEDGRGRGRDDDGPRGGGGGSDALEDPGSGDAPGDEGAPGGVPRGRGR